MNRAAFLDRDGVINRKARKGEYITRWEEVEFLPGVVEAIAALKQSGFLVIVITNQRCVAKGLITIPELECLHRRICDELARTGAVVDAVYYCPHEKQPRCSCRKPAPGMLLEAACDHRIDLAASWTIGDSDIDIEAGRNAGCRTVRILDNIDETSDSAPDLIARSLYDAIQQILQQKEIPA
jgi:D-glycero-D-manno-heptose 1,7-bisphosphate phosphatase